MTYTCVRACTRTHVCVYIHIHTYIHTYIHTHIHTYIHINAHTYKYMYIHTYTHTHTYPPDVQGLQQITFRHWIAWTCRSPRRRGRGCLDVHTQSQISTLALCVHFCTYDIAIVGEDSGRSDRRDSKRGKGGFEER